MTIYYTDYKNGNDTTGNGSSATPYKTLTKALTVVGNSDTVLMRGSDAADEIYYESGMSVTETSLTIGADTGHTPTISPSILRTSWALTLGQSFTYETAYTPAGCYAVWNGATLLTSKASIAEVEGAEDSWYGDYAGDKLYVHIAGGGAPTSINTVYSVQPPVTSGAAGITYRGLRVQWCGAGFTLNNAGTLDTCSVRYHLGAYSGSRNLVLVSATTGTVTVDTCTLAGVYGTLTASRCIWKSGACDLVVVDCTISGGVYGLYSSGIGGSITITDCTFSTCYDCITVGGAVAVTVTISGCTGYEFGHGFVQLNGAGITGVAHHNVAYSLAAPVIQAINAYIAEAGATVAYYHNVAYGLGVSTANGIGFYVLSDDTHATLYNNIAQDCKEGYKIGVGAVTITSDNNCAYSNTNDFDNAPAWPTGAGDITTDPLFTNAAAFDFTLATGSPCIDSGTVIAGINDGYSGTAPDIGRYETAPAFLAAWARHVNRILAEGCN